MSRRIVREWDEPPEALEPALAELGAMVEAYCARPRQPLPADHVVGSPDDADAMGRRLRFKRLLINRLELDFAHDAAFLEATYPDPWESSHPTAVSWIRANCRMTGHAASTAVEVGEEAAALPQSVASLNSGRIGMAHLGLLANTVQMVRQGRERTAARTGEPVEPLAEDGLLRAAERLSVQRFRTACNHVLHAANREEFLREQIEGRQARTLTFTRRGDGLELVGWFDPEGAALIRNALEPLARRSGAHDDREPGLRRADALVELCQVALDAGAVPSRGSQRPHLHVTTTMETLLGLRGAPAGEVEHAGLLADETIQRFACDATMTRVVLDAKSMVIDVGRSERVVHGALRRALNVRDRGCRWPGCQRSVSYTQAHHLVHWVHDGPTNLANTALLCGRHHWMVHEGGWQIVRSDDDEVTVTPPPPDHVALPGWWMRRREPLQAAG